MWLSVKMLIEVVICSAWLQTLASKLSEVVKRIITLLSSTEKVTKVCNSDGQWFHHPESKRVWSNYTLCPAHTKERRKVAHSSLTWPFVSSQKVSSGESQHFLCLQVALALYYMAMVGHSLSIVSLLVCLIIFSYFKWVLMFPPHPWKCVPKRQTLILYVYINFMNTKLPMPNASVEINKYQHITYYVSGTEVCNMDKTQTNRTQRGSSRAKSLLITLASMLCLFLYSMEKT